MGEGRVTEECRDQDGGATSTPEPKTRARIFISGVQQEFAREREQLRDYLRSDPLMRRFFEVFLFEDLPASDRQPNEAHLDEVERCNIYVGLFGKHYGTEDAQGVSPTEREFDRATELEEHRLIFVGRANGLRFPFSEAYQAADREAHQVGDGGQGQAGAGATQEATHRTTQRESGTTQENASADTRRRIVDLMRDDPRLRSPRTQALDRLGGAGDPPEPGQPEDGLHPVVLQHPPP